jgi:DNA polymerase IV
VPRKIIHIDMDAFYASVEQRDEPSLRGLPLAVGGAGERGVVAAASYEARRFGVRSAMSSAVARRLCPGLRFVPPRFDVYKAVSLHIRALFARYTALIEPLSLDEAYLDVTHSPSGLSATAIAQRLRASIREETRLTASAGVSYNKFLAKLASDQNKPDGLCVVTPREGPAFVERLPVGRFHGVGPVTAAKMNRLGIFTGRDLREHGQAFLQEHFGKAGDYYYLAARGIDHRPVRADRPRKSIGSESTFPEDLLTHDALVDGLRPAADAVAEHCARMGVSGRTVTLKLRYADFRQVSRARTLEAPIADRESLLATGLALLAPLEPVEQGVRLMGLTLSGLSGPSTQETEGQLGLGL